jgi:multidrug efflux pump subunit AcrB
VVDGKLREIAPEADPVTRSWRLKIGIDAPPPQFWLGTTATASLAAASADVVIRVPETAIRRVGDASSVWVVDPAANVVNARPVELGVGSGWAGRDPLRARRRRAHRRRRRQQPGRRAARGESGRAAVKPFNLSDWALEHRSLIWYFMLVALVAGVFSYLHLGREEDPAFTIRTMVIAAQWPGAKAEDVAVQVTERIERELQDLESLDYTRSVTTAGKTTVFVSLRNETPAATVRSVWLQVRAMIGDIARSFPQGVQGPFFNDRFGDVFGNIYAFTGDGITQRQLRDYVEDARSKVLTLKEAGSVELIGAQDEVVNLEFSTRRLAALGISAQQVIATLQDQNAVATSGVIEAGPERVAVRVGGQFTSEESLRQINLRVGERFFRLVDVATVSLGYVDPPSALFRYNGTPAIGLAIGMRAGGNLLEFGKALDEEVHKITAELPVGVDVHLVSDQPKVVEEAVDGFTRALFEAVAIVLVVSFLSLGLRAGLVVAFSIPLVLAITFLAMAYFGISLQRVSLGALIIALGLLVDDAMIAVEMMVSRLEAGDTLRRAATAVYTSTAFPMLTGTLVTVAGFIPIGLNPSQAGEFTFTLFVVLAVALLVSWVVAVLFTP